MTGMNRKRTGFSVWHLPAVVAIAATTATALAQGEGATATAKLRWDLLARTMGLWALIAALSMQAVRLVWSFALMPIAHRARLRREQEIIAATNKPAQWLAAFIALRVGSRTAAGTAPPVVEYVAWQIWDGALYVSTVLAAAVLVYSATRALADWYASEFASKTSSRVDDQFILLFRKIAKFVFLFIALTIIFGHFDIQVSGLLATAGIASLAMAFAAQESLANMIAGFVVMIDRPFRVGDRIQLSNGQIGDVIDIGLRSTKILSPENTVITVPNADVSKSQIINLSAPDARLALRQTIGVAYGTDLRQAKAILLEVMSSHPGVLQTPAPAVYFDQFGESSLNLLFVCWIADYRERLKIRDELNMAIKDRFEAAGIVIPFPQRDVHLRVVSDSTSSPKFPASAGRD